MSAARAVSVGRVEFDHGRDAINRRALGAAAAAIAAVLVGTSVAVGYALPVCAALVLGVAMFVGMRNWRWSIYALLAYFPISGIPTIALYPHTQPGVLLKDFVFVIPAYVGCFGGALVHQRKLRYPGLPLITAALFAAIVLVEVLNPSVPSLIVAAVGIKVWLLYLPMLLLGYHLIESREELGRLLALLSITAIIPAIIGVLEALLVYSGQSSTV